MTQNYHTLEGPVPPSQHAGLMHPFRYTTCTKHDSAYCNVTHRGRVWLHISRKMDDNSVVLWRHLPIKALHFSHPHISIVLYSRSVTDCNIPKTGMIVHTKFVVGQYITSVQSMNIITITVYITYKTHKHTHMH